MGYPSVYPTGVTIYDKDKAASGYTIMSTPKGSLLIDMNGREVNLWAGLDGFPNKLLPGGQVFGSTGEAKGDASYQDQLDLLQVDWDGNVVWKWDHTELVADEGKPAAWQARQHHDFQREGSPVGYYAPGLEPRTDGGNTILLVHENSYHPEISDKLLIDDKTIEVTWDGEVVWEWRAAEHFEEFGFDEAARASLYASPSMRGDAGGDWLHTNCVSELGPNKWYDRGDERFAPENLIFDCRNANILAIISKKTGKIVWKLGPRFDGTEAERKLGWIVGQHHLHMIPKGLPGAGDLLVFDNGGAAGYGAPNELAPDGTSVVHRDYSRVVQFNPITLEVTWQYGPLEAGWLPFADGSRTYSPYISSAQRLWNGNTLICEGSDGHLVEVTPDHEIVWEYVSPYFKVPAPGFAYNLVYRAYRAPYEWVPQVERPEEVPIEPPDITRWRVPGASDERVRTTRVAGIDAEEVAPTGAPTLGRPVASDAAGADAGDGDDGHVDFCMLRFDKGQLTHINRATPKFDL